MRYLSVCSGIEAATQAWHPLGWTPLAFSEIDPFPSAVLAHHYPHVPNLGDMTRFMDWPDADIDLLVGGTPCQSFSIAGLRGGLRDPRGQLMLAYAGIAQRYRPRWLVWENVPGVLSSHGGRDFGTFLGALAFLGYGFAWRVLDAQYVRTRRFGRAVPQRRRRVFVVAYLGDWRRAAAVLFDGESLRGNPPPRRVTWQDSARCAEGGASGGGGQVVMAYGLTTEQTPKFSEECALTLTKQSPTGGGQPQAVAFNARQDPITYGGIAGPLDTDGATHAVAFDMRGREGGAMPEGPHDTANIRAASGGSSRSYVAHPWDVRRFTPRECERLQGFPDDYTLIPWIRKAPGLTADDMTYRATARPDLDEDALRRLAPDGARYKALGNSMAVNVMEWIGERIDMVERGGLVLMPVAPTPENKLRAPMLRQARLEKERRRRIRIAVAALAYEEYGQPVMDDDEFDRLASEIMPLFRTGRHDDFFATEFSPDTGMWIHRHPDKAGLRRILREVHGFQAPDKPEDLI